MKKDTEKKATDSTRKYPDFASFVRAAMSTGKPPPSKKAKKRKGKK